MLLNDDYIGYVYDQMNAAIDFLNNGGQVNSEDIMYCINNYDIDKAKEILDYYKINTNVKSNSRVRQSA